MTSSLSREFYLSFFLGISFGIFIAVIVREFQQTPGCSLFTYYGTPGGRTADQNYGLLLGDDYHADNLPFPAKSDIPHGPIVFNDQNDIHHKDGDKVAQALSRKVRILCWVMTQPKTLKTKGQAVKDTWGRRCNVLLFMSSVKDDSFPAIGLDVPEGETSRSNVL